MIRRPPRSTQSRSSAASDVYKRQSLYFNADQATQLKDQAKLVLRDLLERARSAGAQLSLIHISEPTRLLSISYAVFCLKKKTTSRTK